MFLSKICTTKKYTYLFINKKTKNQFTRKILDSRYRYFSISLELSPKVVPTINSGKYTQYKYLNNRFVFI